MFYLFARKKKTQIFHYAIFSLKKVFISFLINKTTILTKQNLPVFLKGKFYSKENYLRLEMF